MSSNAIDPELSRYLRTIQAYPLLTAEAEAELVAQWCGQHDITAAHRLVTSHLRLVAKIALGYRGYGLALADLISEGQLGMLKAVTRFEPAHGSRLASYAAWWIRAAIQEYVLRSWSLVRMDTTAAHKKLFFKLRAVKARLGAADGPEARDLPVDLVPRIAQALNVHERDVVRMNGWVSGRDHSLNTPLREDSDDEWQDRLVDQAASQETALAEREELGRRRAVLRHAMQTLGERERDILSARHLRERPLTLQELGARYGISAERVRQVEMRAVEKLRHAARSLAGRPAIGSFGAAAA
jgi:RNA polymerase sigma-32 factor